MKDKHPLAHLDAAIRDHIERETADNIALGMAPEHARSAALRKFGNVTRIAEDICDVWRIAWLEQLWQDIRFGVRGLRRNPGFAAVVVLTLALGIGANTAIFSLINAVMWRMLPVKDPQGLWLIGSGSTYQQFRAMRDQNQVADLAAYSLLQLNASVDGGLEPTTEGQLVSGSYFSLLGVNPLLGRTIALDDDRVPNGHPVAMISYGYWKRRFALEPSTIGRTISLSGTPFTIIGVTPPEFFGVEVGTAPDIFVPLMMQPTVMPASENLLENPIIYRTFLETLGRLKPGIHAQQAADALWAPYLQGTPTALQSGRFAVKRLALTPAATGLSSLRSQFSQSLFVLMAIVGMVLLIACANTANLLLARAAARRREFCNAFIARGGPLAIGTPTLGRGYCTRCPGRRLWDSPCGLGHSCLGRLYVHGPRGDRARPQSRPSNPCVHRCSFGCATGILFGLAPAMWTTRIAPAPALKPMSGGQAQGGAALRLRRTLAVLQVALSVPLLVSAGLFVRSLQRLNSQDSGFARESVLIARVEPKGSDQRNILGTSQRLDRIYRDLLQRVEDIPGVRSASLAGVTPTSRVVLPAELRLPSGDLVRGSDLVVYPHYFETLGIPMVAGRDFNRGDLSENSPLVCVVNETFVRQAYPQMNPIGKPCLESRRQTDGFVTPQRWEIIGVVRDSRYASLKSDPQPAVYTTFFQTATGRGQMALLVRGARQLRNRSFPAFGRRSGTSIPRSLNLKSTPSPMKWTQL